MNLINRFTIGALIGVLMCSTAAIANPQEGKNAPAITPDQWSEIKTKLPKPNPSNAYLVQGLRFCSSCHGNLGVSQTENWPSVAGQPRNVTIKALLDYRDGRRQGDASSDLMAAVAKTMSDQEIVDIAIKYEQWPGPKAQKNIEPVNEQIKQLVLKGDPSRGVTACSACHGLDARGNSNGEVPIIQGQTRNYLELTLKQYRDDTRTSDMLKEMRVFVQKLTDEEIAGLADYYAAQDGRVTPITQP